MTLTTTNYGFPYPESSDPPNGPSQFSALATAVDTSLNTVAGYVGSWLTWGPTYTGLTIGNGTVEALYKQDISKTGSKTIHFKWRIVAGSTTALSATQLSFTLPVTRNATPGRDIFEGWLANYGQLVWYKAIGDTNTTLTGQTASNTIVRLYVHDGVSVFEPIDSSFSVGSGVFETNNTIYISGTYRGA